MGKFELFRSRTTRKVKEPAATVQARGAFTLNAAALAELGDPEAVHLYFDAEDKRVGIEKADSTSPYAYAARVVGKSSSPSRLISAKTFMDTYGVPYDTTEPVPISFEDNMVVLHVASLLEKQNEAE